MQQGFCQGLGKLLPSLTTKFCEEHHRSVGEVGQLASWLVHLLLFWASRVHLTAGSGVCSTTTFFSRTNSVWQKVWIELETLFLQFSIFQVEVSLAGFTFRKCDILSPSVAAGLSLSYCIRNIAFKTVWWFPKNKDFFSSSVNLSKLSRKVRRDSCWETPTAWR